MTRSNGSILLVCCLLMIAIGGCGNQSIPTSPSMATASQSGPAPLFLSITNDLESNPQSVDMAMKLAGFALAEKRSVFLFFNVKGVNVPTAALPDDAQFGAGPPIKEQLAELIKKGAVAHACPICMKALGVNASDLLEDVSVTNRETLFSKISSNTCVFTY